MIICGCPTKHREHAFQPKDGAWGLCGLCSHALGAHKVGLPDTEVQQLIDLITNATSVKTISAMPMPELGLGHIRLTLDLGLA